MSIDPGSYTPAPDLLKDRVIMVTGAGDGIGATAARTFAKHGATVALLGRTRQKLEAVYDAIESDGRPKPSIAVMDFATAVAGDYQDLADSIDSEFGRLDGVLHNAGILGHRSPIEHYEVATWLDVMHVNLNAQFILTQAILPLLKKSDDPTLVFTSSGVGRSGRAYWGAYAASKFGTEGLMQTLADECDWMRVNCINPGATRTAMRQAAYPEEDPAALKTPADIMATYLYLMGADSRGITGQSLNCQ
ncbi:MAG: YciK family oxidoreductase [Gammaproteobacteria bacterium]|jgi:NAD(P)-dependent dehydrogenase (short-subunit alcohol dehydrogenase family)|nr:YciK family oxidoreductase [Gammaproteobacteria bacterium]MDP6616074.1 YciK family oxidoreductase [Gammaproteobacteria bacterium]MDP6695323.1 YciK family oxidoreductase [Gammaproteobacteria bacterium]MDP7041705.1 YciK family oxidoreductase [Gammaproteobacteria bacterium]